MLVAALLIGLSFLFPLWTLHLTAPQYPETLNLNVYAYKLEGSANPLINDIQEINTLNHYIGMAEIYASNFPELRLIPIALAVTVLLLIVAAALSSWELLAAATAALALTGVGGIASAYLKLYTYGHNLDPNAPLKVPGFTPPLLGSNKLVNFMTHGMFGIGGFMLIVAGVLLLAALYIHLFRRREA
jgi:copper chaperone NosL